MIAGLTYGSSVRNRWTGRLPPGSGLGPAAAGEHFAAGARSTPPARSAERGRSVTNQQLLPRARRTLLVAGALLVSVAGCQPAPPAVPGPLISAAAASPTAVSPAAAAGPAPAA